MWRHGDTAGLFARLRAECSSRLGRASLLVLGCAGLGRGAALCKEALVAALFGVGGALDAYLLALLAPSFLTNLLGSIFSSALIPALGRAEREGGGAHLRGRALLAQALLVFCACLLLALVPAGAWRALAPTATPERLALLRELQLLLLPAMALASLNNTLGALANAQGRFAGPALAGLGNALAVLAGVAVLAGGLGVRALALAVDMGAACEFALLAWMCRGLFGWRRAGPGADIRPLLRGWGVLALGAALFGLAPFIDNAIAGALGEGAVSALGFGARLPLGIAGLLGLALSTVLLPHFSHLAATAEPQALRAACRGMALRVALLAGPLALAGVLASPLVTELLFQRGRFDAQAVQAVSAVQAWYFVQIPFYLLAIGAMRLLQAQERRRLLLVVQAGLLALGALASLGFSRVLGVAGIAASSALVQALLAGACLLAVLRPRGARS
ncbi:MviN-like protein [Humidesulfovibrio mexicanus]|uniref:MviN-like protein n=1 Tax=Humidesulfovibrio mexicanus TaxID=147047 RepID=A0A238ZZL7_9BACT|nr:lipid II flippase MurJ [Humidesulfovibrio mexicanus]SNR88835.1 MviN-like protein [Humidesulfovibrio mexicanus]